MKAIAYICLILVLAAILSLLITGEGLLESLPFLKWPIYLFLLGLSVFGVYLTVVGIVNWIKTLKK